MLHAIVRSYRDAFSGLPRQVWVLATCLFVNRLGMMVLPFFELYLTGRLGYEVEVAGRLVSLYGVGSILGVTLGGWCTDRFGAKRVQVASLVLNALGLLLLWRMRTAMGIGAVAVFVSLASDAFRPANGAAIAAAAGPEQRARSFSLMSLAVNLGLSLGLPLGGLLARFDFDWLFWIDAGTALCAALFLAVHAESSAVPRREAAAEAVAVRSPWRDGTFLVVVGLLCLTATVLFQFFGALPVFLKHDLGFDEAGVGLALAMNTFCTAAFGMLVVRWVERRAELRWLGVGSFLVCAGYGLDVFGTNTPLALVSILVWSVGEMFFFPLGAAFASRRAPGQAIGRYMSTYHLGFALAFVLAPLVGTQLYASLGPRGLWAVCLATGVFVLFAFWLLQWRLERPAERTSSVPDDQGARRGGKR